MSNKTKLKQPTAEAAPIKLNFGCGQIPVPGFIGVDLYAPQADQKVDLFKFPFPWKDNSVDEILASHFVEHVGAKIRWPFFDECWRILKPGAVMRIIVPNFKSERAYGDCTHEWPPLTAFSFLYLNRGWREANKLTHGPYALKCDFDHQCGPSGIDAQLALRSHEVQMDRLRKEWENYQDMWACLTKKA